MGVRGLQTFVEKYCPEACYEVDIGKLAQEHKRRTGEVAKIVVDAQSCYNLWYKGLDWLVGQEVQELVNRLRTFVDNFKQLGIQLIFFFGGLTPEKKRNEWIQRRRRNIKEIHTIFDILKDGGELPPHYNSIPPNMGLTTSYILKHILLCQVHMSVDEADEEIVDYAHQHSCFALFGQDTDFIVSELNDTIVLSAKNFNVKTMTTLRYDREKLAQHLQIRCEELPLLALLAGNDFIRYDTIKPFHRRLCNIDTPSGMIPFNALMPAIGRYINALPTRGSIEATLEHIANDLLQDPSGLEVLRMSYSSYFIREARIEIRPEDEWSRILYVAKYRHRMTLAPNTVYSIMNDRIFECSTAFEDLRLTHDGNSLPRNQPSSTVTRPLRLRLYGVLLQEKRPPITVQEYCGDNCDSYTEPVVVDPILPTVRHPGLVRMWSDDNSDRLLNCRWELFLTSIHPQIKKRNLQMADDNLFASLCAYYLYKVNFLDVYELDAVLATIATFRLYRHSLAHELEYELDYRAAHISITFIRTYGLILTLLAACGYPIDLCPKNAIPNFEGKIFQMKYAEVMKNKNSYQYNNLCEHLDDCKQAFHRMRRFIRPEFYKRKDPSKMRSQLSAAQFVQE